MFIDRGWQFREAGAQIWSPATVPGSVLLDLQSNQRIGDPFWGSQERSLDWVGKSYWIYRTQFALDRATFDFENIDLVFEGLDTYAKVFVNGGQVLTAENMFRAWRIPVRHLLQSGQNILEVHFSSPINKVLPGVRGSWTLLPAPLDPGEKTSPYTRKAPYQFGWDWAPRLVSVGIWKPVFLEMWSGVRIEDIWIRFEDVRPEAARLSVEVELQSSSAGQVSVLLQESTAGIKLSDGHVDLRADRTCVKLHGLLAQPALWWPRGFGAQPLYTFEVELWREGRLIEKRSVRTGIRTVALRRQPDEWGESFEFVVNGTPLFIKGGNWVPADSFPTRVSRERYRRLLRACLDANMNLVRVWGGGLYESADFYELCDEMGLLVWQDFVFANALYPLSGAFLDDVRKEASHNIKRLRNHPSLALWCGNNEVESGWFEWGWKKRFHPFVWQKQEAFFRDELARLCAQLDPGRPYWPSSPSSVSGEKPNSGRSGDSHAWEVWHSDLPFDAYRDVKARFVSELGFLSFPDLKTIERMAGREGLSPDSEAIKAHLKSANGMERVRQAISRYYGEPRDIESLVYLSQLAQALAVKTAVEHLRRNTPRTMGCLYWQINDCWPAVSWSSIDYFGRWKALHYYARRFYQESLVSSYEDQGQVHVAVVSDRGLRPGTVLNTELISLDGKVLLQRRQRATVLPLKGESLWQAPVVELLAGRDRTNVFLLSELILDGQVISSSCHLFAIPRMLQLKPAPPQFQVKRLEAGRYAVGLSTERFAKDVRLSLRSFEVSFSDNYFDLIPGRPKEIVLELESDMDPDTLRTGLQVRSLADFLTDVP
ncbi:MAG: glycoside hydrolase family 2 protein [Acidobacteriota bacterium]